jgi:hypothetical protein
MSYAVAKTPEKDLLEERTIEGMRLQRVGRGQYRAWSTTVTDTCYAVDLTHYGGLGSCTCDDFTKRRLPRWRGVRKRYDIYRCRHIRRVRNHVLDQIIDWSVKH